MLGKYADALAESEQAFVDVDALNKAFVLVEACFFVAGEVDHEEL